MIITITLNPSIDKTLIMDKLRHNVRVFSKFYPPEPGGKGINISKVLNVLKIENRAFVVLGGNNGHQFSELCHKGHLRLSTVPISGETRENITLLVGTSHLKEYKINSSGPKISLKESLLIKKHLSKSINTSSWVTIGGSLPPGLNENIFIKMITEACAIGTKIIYDGESKKFLERNGKRIFLVKPNRHELSRLTGDNPRSIAQFAASAGKLLRTGISHILLTLDADGALWVNAEGVWHARSPAVQIKSTIGAGDSTIAGAIAGWDQGGGVPRALAMAVACGTATAMCPGSSVSDASAIKKLFTQIKIKQLFS